MSQYDVYKSRDGSGWLLNIQSDLMSGLSTRVVVPLLPIESAPMPALRLNPVFVIEGEKAVMTTQFLATISENELKKSVSNLRNHHQEISQALDLLFLGF